VDYTLHQINPVAFAVALSPRIINQDQAHPLCPNSRRYILCVRIFHEILIGGSEGQGSLEQREVLS
jgi:hypothetical protein